MRKLFALAMVLALLAVPAAGVAATADQQAAMGASQPKANCTYFPETNHNLCAGFLRYWQTYGGLAVYGFPVTEEFVENGHTVQYFERARFEWHPGEWPARWDVMLGLLGNSYAEQHDLLGTAPFQKVASCEAAGTQGLSESFLGSGTPCWFFDATGHSLQGAFAEYWQANGGLAVFGYPISEPFAENGMTVQYFERARFEWHPEFAGTSSAVELGLLGDRALMGAQVTTLASGLDNPRQMFSTYDAATGTSTVYVAEAGKTGGDCVEATDPESGETTQLCFGTNGKIAKIVNGQVTALATGLPSFADPTGEGAVGPTSISSKNGSTFWTVVGGPGPPEDAAKYGDRAKGFGKLYKIDGATGQATVAADIAQYEWDHNPDKNPGSPGEAATDTNAYAVYDAGSYRLVTDAAANDLLKVDADGTISVVAVFPEIEMDAPPFLNMPAGAKVPAQAVPTSIAVGPDGNYYVGLLTGFPFEMGKAVVYKVTPDGQMSVYATGFTNIIALTFDSLGHLFVGEIVHEGLLAADEGGPAAHPGAVYRVNFDGSKTLIANVPALGGLAVGPDGTLYASANSTSAGVGQVVKIEY